MREYVADVKLLPVVVNHGDDAKIIPSDIEHRMRRHVIDGVKGPLHLDERLEAGCIDNPIPRLQRCTCRRMLAPKSNERFLRDTALPRVA